MAGEEKNATTLKPVIPYTGNEFSNEVKYEGTKKDLVLPKATHKGLQVTVYGKFTHTYAGAPVATGNGIAHDLLKDIEIEDGVGDLRNVRPQDMRRLMKVLQGSDSPALYQHNATELTNPTTGYFTFAGHTSGQVTSFRETFHIPFEAVIAEASFLSTLMIWNGRKDNVIRFDMAKTLDAIQKPSNVGANPVVYTDVDIKIRVESIVTALDGGGKRWVQRPQERNHTAAAQGDYITLNDVRNLASLEILATYGADNTPVTFAEAEKIFVDLIGKKNGVTENVKNKISLADLMFNDLAKKAQKDIIPGYARMNFINGSLLDSALANIYDDLWFRFYHSGLANYGSGYNFRVLINEIS